MDINVRVLQWEKDNTETIIQKALEDARQVNFNLLYTTDWLAGIVCRETGGIIAKYLPNRLTAPQMSNLTRGDFSQRPHDKEKIYHGYGLTQVDVDSFPAFVKSGDWKDPYKTFAMTIKILEGKRHVLQSHGIVFAPDELEHAITAAYNCGEGNELSVLRSSEDVDARTTGHNYSAQVWQFREIYKTL